MWPLKQFEYLVNDYKLCMLLLKQFFFKYNIKNSISAEVKYSIMNITIIT